MLRYFKIEEQLTPYWNAEPSPYPDDLVEFVLGACDPRPMPAYDIKHGHIRGDILSDAAWSVRMTQALQECRATGISFYPITVTRLGKPIEGYVGIRITGRGGRFDERRSKAKRKGRILVYHEGMYMDETQWDGSDVFAIPGLGINIFVVERVANVLRKLGLRGVDLIPHTECKGPLQ